MRYKIEQLEQAVLIRIEGNFLGEDNGGELLNQVDDLIAQQEKKFVIDLSGLEYMNSTGIGCLMSILTKSRKVGGETVVFEVPDTLKKLLSMTKLDQVITSVENLETALKVVQL